MPWKYITLVNTISGLYYRTNDIESLLSRANFNVSNFVLDGSSAKVIWTLAIKKIEQLNKIQALTATSLEDFPENPILQDYHQKDNTQRNSVYAGPDLDWKGSVSKAEFEKITGEQSTLLPISFLEVGLTKSKAVARIITPGGLGTGFLISDTNLLLTNNHVIPAPPTPGNFTAQFNYQKTVNGLAAGAEDYEIEDSVFYTSIDDDWTVVKLRGNPAEKYGFIPLNEVSTKFKDFVNIIQHPGGEHKQIGLYHNLVTFANDQRIQYLTDTLPGSSGSPVFNSKWDVVALHHSGGWLEEPGKSGTPAALKNQGININLILKSLRSKGILN